MSNDNSTVGEHSGGSHGSAFLWDAQVRQEGKWVSIYGPFEDMEDAEDVVEQGIKRATTSTAFRIIPSPNKQTQARAGMNADSINR